MTMTLVGLHRRGESTQRIVFAFQTEPALMYDSVYAFATGLQALERGHTLTISNVSCEAEVPWNGGLSLINYINSVNIIHFIYSSSRPSPEKEPPLRAIRQHWALSLDNNTF